jgi:hypothetical protein
MLLLISHNPASRPCTFNGWAFVAFLLVFILFAGGFIQATAQAEPTGDPLVAKALKKAQIPYEMARSGEFKVVMPVPESRNRTQLVLINSKPFEYEGQQLRLLYSIVYKQPRRPSQQQYERLLMAPAQQGIFNYTVIEQEGEYLVALAAYFPAKATGVQLKALMQDLIKAADKMEQEMTNEDRY